MCYCVEHEQAAVALQLEKIQSKKNTLYDDSERKIVNFKLDEEIRTME